MSASPYYMASPALSKASYSPSLFDCGYDSSSEASVTGWDLQFSQSDLLSPFDFSTAVSTPDETPSTPAFSVTERSPSPKKGSAPTSEPMSEEERRRSRKREQNRESQRAFRRRQENRVKFLESKTLELEASSRYLRAENQQLKDRLRESETKNEALMSMISAPPSPFEFSLEAPTEAEAVPLNW